MFKAANPYDEVVTKATAETLTSENWEVNLEVCDKVSGEGEVGARNCVNAIQKRLVHRNANVQLYALTLSDALAKNCGIEAHRELASRTFTQAIQRIVVDRNTHQQVRTRALGLIKEWTRDFGSDDSLGMVKETKEALRAQGYKFDDDVATSNTSTAQQSSNEPSSEQLRKEDEELRRVLELSLQDQGGRGAYTSSSNQAQAGSSAGPSNSSAPAPAASSSSASASVPVASTAVNGNGRQTDSSQQPIQPVAMPSHPSRVRALYDFTPSEVGELAFHKGDLIRVLDSVYEHWWRGEVRGEAGIFPVNYVEILPDPTPAEIQREAEQEAKIFAQAHDIDRLLSKLRSMDPATANLADDEELQELYQTSLSMRPKIVRLIDRYSSKVDELRAMNEKFVRARGVYDGIMERTQQQQQQQQQYQGGQYGHRAPSGAVPPPQEAYSQPQPQGYYPQQQQQAQQPPQQQQQPQQQPQQQQQQQYDPQAYAQWYAQQQQQPQPQPQGGPPQQVAQQPQQQYPGYPQQPVAQQQQQQQPSYPGQSQAQQATAPTEAQPYHYPQQQFYNHSNHGHSQAHGPSAEEEKKRLYEAAKREAEAYHAAYGQGGQQGQGAGPSAAAAGVGPGPAR